MHYEGAVEHRTVFLAVLTVTVLLAGGASAHGAQEHFMGTVKAIAGTSITVEVKGKDRTVAVDAATKFERDGETATAKDLGVGDRVVVHAMKKSGQSNPHAMVVKFSVRAVPPDDAPPMAGHHDKHHDDH